MADENNTGHRQKFPNSDSVMLNDSAEPQKNSADGKKNSEEPLNISTGAY